MKTGVKKTMKNFRNVFLEMIQHRKQLGVGQRELSAKMDAVYHYVNKIEKDIKEKKLEGKTVLLAARYADALDLELQFRVVGKTGRGD